MHRSGRLTRAIVLSAIALAISLAGPRRSWAQGCILIRQSAPIFGTSGNFVPDAGDVNVSFSYRTSHADDHYNGTIHQNQRQQNVTYVVNDQQALDIFASYAVTRRVSFAMAVPYIDASWSIPTPISTTGPRAEQNASGIGDITVSGGYWFFDPQRHRTGNLFLTLGVKAPTGDYNQRDDYADIGGGNTTPKVVDQSIQPGDGGWGIALGLQGFKKLGRLSLYGAGSYLANPRDTNGAPSIVVGLGFAGNPAFASLLENTVPDSYLLRAGASFPLRGRLSGSLGWRMEGVPRYDIIGESHGFRRPGYETYVEPGIIFNAGNSSWSLHVPFGLVRDRQHNPYTGNPGDATFPDYVVLAGYAYRFAPFGHPSRSGS